LKAKEAAQPTAPARRKVRAKAKEEKQHGRKSE
jgi:hypothetical protein